MAYIKIEHWQLPSDLDPNKILDTYLKRLCKAAPLRAFSRTKFLIQEQLPNRKGKKVLLEYCDLDKSWKIYGRAEKALLNAEYIGLTSPYLKLFRYNLNRYSNQKPCSLLGVPSNIGERLFYEKKEQHSNAKHSTLFTLRLAAFIHFLKHNNDCPISSLTKLNPCTNHDSEKDSFFWQERDVSIEFCTSILQNDDRHPNAYKYMISKMSKCFQDTVIADSIKTIQSHLKSGNQFRHVLTPNETINMSKTERLGFFGMLYFMQNGPHNCDLDAFLSQSGLGYKPGLFVNRFMDKDMTIIRQPQIHNPYPFTVNELLFHNMWKIDIAYIDTQKAQQNMVQIQNSSYFYKLSGQQGFSQYSYLMSIMKKSKHNLKKDKPGKSAFKNRKKQDAKSNALSEASRLSRMVFKANSESVTPPRHSDDKFSASMVRIKYSSFVNLSISLIATAAIQRTSNNGLPVVYQCLDKGIEIQHPKSDSYVIDAKIASILKMIRSPIKSKKNEEIDTVIELLFEIIYQRPLMGGNKTFAETLGQALFYLIGKKHGDNRLMCYWSSHLGTSWDIMAYGCILEETMANGPEDFFIHGFKKYILAEGKDPWTKKQASFLKTELKRLEAISIQNSKGAQHIETCSLFSLNHPPQVTAKKESEKNPNKAESRVKR